MVHSNHSHTKVIDNMEDIYPMVSLIDDSKYTYVKDNLSKHLHSSQIKLLKQVNKHSKPHHRKVLVAKYKKLSEDPDSMDSLFELHKNLYLKKYQKLEKKGLVEVNTECDVLPYYVELTQDGIDILNEIKKLEEEWQEIVLKDAEDKDKLVELLKSVTQNALTINYEHKKQQKFVF